MKAMTRSKCLSTIPFLVAVVLFANLPGSAVGGSDPVPAVNTADGVGLKGYDPVAYFTPGGPTPGVDQYTYRWKGVTYRFASAEDLGLFKANPEKYLPQYGGYCAYAMSLNRIADINPFGVDYRRRETLLEQRIFCTITVVTQQERKYSVR